MFISGRVEVDDGSSVPRGVVIERVCGGAVRQEAYADARGYFSFELGRNLGVLPDSSVSGSGMDRRAGNFGNFSDGLPDMGSAESGRGMNRRRLFGCELRASASGFRSTVADLSRYDSTDIVNVGIIFLQRAERVQGTTLSATSFQAPKDARKAYEKGLEAAKKGKLAEAQKELEKAVQIYPRHAAAWFELGLVLQAQKQVEAARKAYSEALSADPRFVSPYFPLAQIAAQDGKWQEVLDITGRALELDPLNSPAGYYFNAAAYYKLGNLEAAEKSARRAERLDQQHRIPRLHLLLGAILEEKKDYAGAIAEMRNYVKLSPQAGDAEAVKARLVNLEKLGAPAAPSQP